MTTRIILTITTIIFVGVIGYAYLSLPYKGTMGTTPTTTQVADTGATNTTGAAVQTQPTTSGSTGTTNTGGSTHSSGSTQPSGITMAMVAKHSSQSSCWTAINGKVYDVTSWIDQHPGGASAILSLCGTDGSSAFDAQHGGQGRPESELANFYIGALAQ